MTLPNAGANPTYTPTATSTSGLPVTLSVDAASDGCTITGGVVTFNHTRLRRSRQQSSVVDVSDAAKCNDSKWQVIKDQGTGADGTVTSGDGCLAFVTGGGTLAGLRLVRSGTALAPSFTFGARNVDLEGEENSDEFCNTDGCGGGEGGFEAPVDAPFMSNGSGGLNCELGPDGLSKVQSESWHFHTRGRHNLAFSVSCSNGTPS